MGQSSVYDALLMLVPPTHLVFVVVQLEVQTKIERARLMSKQKERDVLVLVKIVRLGEKGRVGLVERSRASLNKLVPLLYRVESIHCQNETREDS